MSLNDVLAALSPDMAASITEALRAKDEALRTKDEAIRAKDEAIRAKDGEITALRRENNQLLRAAVTLLASRGRYEDAYKFIVAHALNLTYCLRHLHQLDLLWHRGRALRAIRAATRPPGASLARNRWHPWAG